MRGGTLASPINLSAEEQNAMALLGGEKVKVRESLNALNNSLVLNVLQGGNYCWKFKHPTVRDAFASLVIEDHELLSIYLLGAPLNSLVSEITCGKSGGFGAKVVVPEALYHLVLRR